MTRQGRRILVIHRRSAYTATVSEGRNRRIARLVREGHPLGREMLRAHEEHLESVHEVRRALARLGLRARFLHRTDGLRVRNDDLVVVVGGDGTVLHVSHLVGDAGVLAFNSAPHASCGFLTVATCDRAEAYLAAAMSGRLPATFLQRMRVDVDGRRVTDRVLNDCLFSNACPASTTRYVLRRGAVSEEHFSSGVWISTAAGSTAATHAAGGRILPLGSHRLQFVVREPYELGPRRATYRLVHGFVRRGDTLELTNAWRPAVVYVDGPHVSIPVAPAATVRFSLSRRPLRLLGYDAAAKRTGG
ncbi:MAG: NAD(+)/NADH kinase [Deltaproteobacteria bacterium]|nr:NAD(+)/NADH kinase [Deltaproteobacteria bacterium]